MPETLENRVRTLLRNELPQLAGRQNASPYAQRVGSGLGIQHVTRGVGRAELIGLGSNITVSATSYAALSTPLMLQMVLSGRPLRVGLRVILAPGSSGSMDLDVNLRGRSITGGRLLSTNQQHISTLYAEETVMQPDPGDSVLEVVALRATANGTIYVQGTNSIVLTAEEL